MKVFSKFVLTITLFSFLFSITSCFVVVPKQHHDNGKHKGWYKKSKHSSHDDHQGDNGKHKGKHKGKKH